MELLAVIVILAIIALIAVPIVLDYINEAKIKTYVSNENSVKEAAKLYLTKNLDELPKNIGDIYELSIKDLYEGNYLEQINDPESSSIKCNGYVIVTKLGSNSFDYSPHLKCGNMNYVNNSLEDGIVAHYKFDDFQEPTVNLVVSPEFSNGSLGLKWGSWENSVLTFERLSLLGKETNVTNMTKRTAGTTNAIHQAIPNLTIDSPYTLSFYARINPNSLSDSGKIKAYINGYVDYSITKEWTRISLTQIAKATSQTIHITQFSPEYDVQIAYVSLENKEYSTDFVNGTRTAKIKDYSGHGYDSGLDPLTSPKWVNNGNKNTGAYKFSKNNEVITAYDVLTNVFNNQSYSWGAWINIDNSFSSNGRILMSQSNALELSINSYRKIYISYKDLNKWNSLTASPILSKDNWYHIFVTFEDNTMKLYINGKLEGELISDDFINPSDNIYIGNWSSNQVFKGMIDDVRIYNRALDKLEVERIYYTTKS